MEEGRGGGGISVMPLYLDTSPLFDCTAGHSIYFNGLAVLFPLNTFHVLYWNLSLYTYVLGRQVYYWCKVKSLVGSNGWNIPMTHVQSYYVQTRSITFTFCPTGSNPSTAPELMSSKLTQIQRRTGFPPASMLLLCPISMTAQETSIGSSAWMAQR